MYESFYGLKQKPFQLNPDPLFYFDSRQHRRAMAFLEYGLHQNEGFIVVTGEVGAGKTTLVRNLLGNLDATKVVAANLVSTQLDADDTLRMVAAAFGIRSKDVNKAELLLTLEAHLASVARQGKRSLLVVDEAQNLSVRAVEELRMLSNFQLGTHTLLQSFLVGQPEFRQILQSPHMHQLRQRVIAACHIGPLDADETRAYIEHRLRCAGWKDVPLIQPGAFLAIFEASGGVPRRINLICDRLLLSGFLADKRVFTAETVKEVADEINDETLTPKSLKRRASDLEEEQPAPDAAAEPVPPPAAVGDSGVVEVDFTRKSEIRAAEPHYGVVSKIDTESLGEQLLHVEEGMRGLESTLLRVERGNLAAMALFRRFLDWVRSQESKRNDSA